MLRATPRRYRHPGGVPAVLFDVDGVLVASWSAYRQVWSHWAQRHRPDVETVWAGLGRC